MRPARKLMFAVTGVACLFLLGGVALLGRQPLRSWYYLRNLDRAGEGNRDAWFEKVVGLDSTVGPALIDRLCRNDPRVCANAAAALTRLVQRWGPDDTQGETLARSLRDSSVRFSPAGRREALQFASDWLSPADCSAPSLEVARALAALLPGAFGREDAELRGQALTLAARLLARPDGVEFLGPCRVLTQSSLSDAEPQNRARSLELALYPGMDLQRQLRPLLHDPAAKVRQLALLALGPAQDVILTEELLHWLHDPDPEVRRLCEMALRGRKLSEGHIRLGRLLTDARPSVRLEVLDHMHRTTDIDPGVWLRHLSHDPVASVRAAAMRAATWDYPQVSFSDRLEQMCADASPTVGQLAQYYLPQKKRQEEVPAP